MRPVRLEPAFYEKVWGSTELEPWFSRSQKKIGEVWFQAEPRLPILVKFLFTSEKLSVQVHPDDAPGAPGKTEMWHILRAQPEAAIALGFREPIPRERLREAALSGEIEQLLRWIPVQPGETYFTPARTVHAIGGGIALCEIQQNTDVTYRLYDYGRPRELHLEQALAVADLGRHPGASIPVKRSEQCQLLAECRHFRTASLRVVRDTPGPVDPDRFHLLICVAGHGRIGEASFAPGEVWLVPAGAAPFALRPAEPSHFLHTCVPRPSSEVGG